MEYSRTLTEYGVREYGVCSTVLQSRLLCTTPLPKRSCSPLLQNLVPSPHFPRTYQSGLFSPSRWHLGKSLHAAALKISAGPHHSTPGVEISGAVEKQSSHEPPQPSLRPLVIVRHVSVNYVADILPSPLLILGDAPPSFDVLALRVPFLDIVSCLLEQQHILRYHRSFGH